MPSRLCLVLLVLAFLPGPARAQYFRPVRPPVVPGAPFLPGYGYYPGPALYGYYDPYSGYFRGVGDLITSSGRYYNDYQSARLLNQQVEREKIRTRRMLAEERRYEQSLLPTSEELRERRRQLELRRALNDPPGPACPASLLRTSAAPVVWWVDARAAARVVGSR